MLRKTGPNQMNQSSSQAGPTARVATCCIRMTVPAKGYSKTAIEDRLRVFYPPSAVLHRD
jgi:hypothetical protein